jgi:two-component system NarL family sensor kinase
VPSVELTRLRAGLAEANEALRAIRSGEVDAVVVAGKKGTQVFSLGGSDHAYRMLIEAMNEGALTLTFDKMILYANQCFARMVKCPLEKVMGGSFRRFLSAEDRVMLRSLLRRVDGSGAKFQVLLITGDGSRLPVQISIRPLAKNGSNHATIGMVVTDMTEARRTEEMLRALTHRVVQVQEAERGRVAFELHDNITQLICAVLFRSQALADGISPRDGASKGEAIKLREMLARTADEVARISHNLGPNVLEHLGLVAALGDASTEFESRTGVSVKLECSHITVRLTADIELAFFRILQEALRNVEKHASARNVSVRLSRQGEFVRLAINDDGVGFDADRGKPSGNRRGGLGLLSMRERATCVGGTLKLKSLSRSGTEIEVLVPLMARVAAN